MKRIATLAAGIALMLPASAMAAPSSTCQAYNPQICQTTASCSSSGGSSNNTGTTASSNEAGGGLPFTGLDVALIAVGGGTLVGAGVAVRRLSRQAS